MRKCAILLSGGISYSYNYERYKNDLCLAYDVLKNVGNFEDENIFLFYGDGIDDFKNIGITPYAAIKIHLLKHLENMSQVLDENDEFVLVVSNHGGDEQDGNIRLWGCEYIALADLIKYLSRIRAKKLIILGECFAGNMLKYDIDNSCIFTANERGKPSYACLKHNYDEFIYHFFSYILGMYPDTRNRIPQGKNNLIEAYQYARSQDAFCPDNKKRETILIDGNEIIEIPQMKNSLEKLPIEF